MTRHASNPDNPGSTPQAAEPTRGARTYRPNVDVLERADEILLFADMPGVAHDGIDIRFEHGTLTIHASVRPREPADRDYLLHEYGVGDFRRSFDVSEAVDASRISAEYVEGVLTVHLPRTAESQPRKIPVRVA